MDLGRRFPDRQVGSNRERFTAQLIANGVPLDLSTAAVTFSMITETGTAKVSAAAAVGDASGVASYAPTTIDVDTPGNYTCQFVAVLGDGRVHKTEVFGVRLLPNPGG